MQFPDLVFWIQSAFPLHGQKLAAEAFCLIVWVFFFLNRITDNSDFGLLLIILLYCQCFALSSSHEDPNFYKKNQCFEWNHYREVTWEAVCMPQTKTLWIPTAIYFPLPMPLCHVKSHIAIIWHDIAIISKNLCSVSSLLIEFTDCLHHSS